MAFELFPIFGKEEQTERRYKGEHLVMVDGSDSLQFLTFEASFSSFSSKEILTELFFRRTHSASCQTRLFLVSVAVSPLVSLVPEDTLMSMHCLHNGNPQSGHPATLLH